MKVKAITAAFFVVMGLVGVQVASAQGIDSDTRVQQLPNLDDIPMCHDISQDSKQEYCKGDFHSSWFRHPEK